MVVQPMMTEKYSLSKNEIIKEMQPVVRQICQSVAARNQDYHLVDDLVQEINIILLSQIDETIQSLYETGQFKYFVARITTNQVLSNTSTFHKVYRDRGLKDAPIYEDYDTKADKLWQKVTELDHKLSKDILILRFEYGLKISEIAKLKGFTERYIYKNISKSLKYLKKD